MITTLVRWLILRHYLNKLNMRAGDTLTFTYTIRGIE